MTAQGLGNLLLRVSGVALLERGEVLIASGYVALSVVAGCGLCLVGMRVARALWAT